MRVKQYGLQRTGTNAVKALLEDNFHNVEVLTTTYGSKHDLPEPDVADDPELRFCVNVKDPLSWLVSYHRYRSLQAREEKPSRRIDPLTRLADVWLERWEENTYAYLSLAERYPGRSTVIQHEHLLRNPGEVVSQLERDLDLERRGGRPSLFLKGYARRGNEYTRGAELIDRDRSFDRARHLNGKWATGLPREVRNKGRDCLNEFLQTYPHYRRYFNLSHLKGIL